MTLAPTGAHPPSRRPAVRSLSRRRPAPRSPLRNTGKVLRAGSWLRIAERSSSLPADYIFDPSARAKRRAQDEERNEYDRGCPLSWVPACQEQGDKTGLNRLLRMGKERFYSFGLILGVGLMLLVSLAWSTLVAAMGRVFGPVLPVPEPVLHAASS